MRGLIVEHGTLLLFLFGTALELLGSLQGLEVLSATLGAFHTNSGLLGNLGLKTTLTRDNMTWLSFVGKVVTGLKENNFCCIWGEK